jgi:YD repeat-containing protein
MFRSSTGMTARAIVSLQLMATATRQRSNTIRVSVCNRSDSTDLTQQTINYDIANNVTSVVDQAAHTVGYGYDIANNLVSVTQANSPNPSANTVNYCRNGLGNSAWVSDANGHIYLADG